MKFKLSSVYNFLLMTFGAVIYGVGVVLFFDSNNIAPGGVSGISIILDKTVGIMSTGTWSFVINIPILLLGAFKFGGRFIFSTVYTVTLSSLVMDTAARLNIVLTDDVLLAAIFGALLTGGGIGLVFRSGATTGGSDIIIRILRTKYRHISTGSLFFGIDCAIIAISAIAFGNVSSALYAAVVSFLQTRIINTVLYGTDSARLVYIISEKSDAISKRLLLDLETGVTILDGHGAYTNSEKEVIMCVLPPKNLPKAKDIVRCEDEEAFLVVTSATSVFGEGYKKNIEEEI